MDRSGRDVQPESACGHAIEAQRFVDFVEVEVRADLDRPVADVRDFDPDALARKVRDVLDGQPVPR